MRTRFITIFRIPRYSISNIVFINICIKPLLNSLCCYILYSNFLCAIQSKFALLIYTFSRFSNVLNAFLCDRAIGNLCTICLRYYSLSLSSFEAFIGNIPYWKVLTLIWLRDSPYLKPVWSMLESWSFLIMLCRYLFSGNEFFSNRTLFILLISVIFCNNSEFWFFGKNDTFAQRNIVRFVSEMFFSSAYRFYDTINYHLSFTDYESGIRLLDCSKFAINGKMIITSQIANIKFSSLFLMLPRFSRQFYLLVQVSCQYQCWLCSYDNFFTKDWQEIQKLEITQSEFIPISGDWGKLGIPNLARMSRIVLWMLKNTVSVTVSELLREEL